MNQPPPNDDGMAIKVEYHLIIDFEAFKGVIDSLGGIDVDEPEPGDAGW